MWADLYKKAFEDAARSEQGVDPAPVNAVYPPTDPIESEEQRKERMWRAVVETSGSSR